MSSTSGDSQSGDWLDETEEFKLISKLCASCCHCLEAYQLPSKKATSRRRNQTRTLTIELRKALTRCADLNLLIDIDWAKDNKDIDDAKQKLEDLCTVLEPLCTQQTPEPHRRSGGYVNLRALLRCLEGSSDTFSDIISTSGYPSALFSYPLEASMLEAIRVVKSFNGFLDKLNRFTAELDSEEPTGESPAEDTQSVEGENLSNLSIKSDGSRNPLRSTKRGLESSFEHAQSVLRSMLSRLSTCSQGKVEGHGLVVQLPTVQETPPRISHVSDIRLELFLSACTDSSRWQKAQITFNLMSETTECYPCQSICDAITRASHFKNCLRFHVRTAPSNSVENNLAIPISYSMEGKGRDLKPYFSLRQLLEADFFKPGLTANRFLSPAHLKSPVANTDEKISLAIQILLGVLQYDSNMATWDSSRVLILATKGAYSLKEPPYISIIEGDPGASYLELPDLQASLESIPVTSPTFTNIAKLLLEIGFGACLPGPQMDTDSDRDELWKYLWEMVLDYGRLAGRPDGLEMKPYFKAAELCLRFTQLYMSEVWRLDRTRGLVAGEITTRKIVERIVSNQIVSVLSQKEPEIISMDSVVQARRSAKESQTAGKRPRTDHLRPQKLSHRMQRKPTLSNNASSISEDSPLVRDAEEFFSNLKEFQTSFESFLKTAPMCGEANRPIRIAILDTGINKGSVAINFDNGQMKDDWCVSFVDGDDTVHDRDGHGTHCASLLQEAAPNAEIYIAKVFSHTEFDLKQAENIPKAICYATSKWNVDIISMSFELHLPSQTTDMDRWRHLKFSIEEAIRSSHPRLLFAAAANHGKNKSRAFPSSHDSVFCVHASDGLGNDCGINPDHDGAGNNIMTLGTGLLLYDDNEDAFVHKVGTSFATAIAAGMVASILDLTSRVPQLDKRSKAGLKTREGMKMLFGLMSGSNTPNPRPYVVPWKYWKPRFWNASPRGLDRIWAELDDCFWESPR